MYVLLMEFLHNKAAYSYLRLGLALSFSTELTESERAIIRVEIIIQQIILVLLLLIHSSSELIDIESFSETMILALCDR